MRTPHSICPRGKRVRVVLRDGTEFVDKFLERTNKKVVIFENHRVRVGEIKSFMIVRGWTGKETK